MSSWDGAGASPAPRFNRSVVAATASAIVVLAVVGATAGWILAGRAGTGAAGSGGSPSPSVGSAAPSTTDTATPSSSSTATGGTVTGNPDGFRLPDVTDQDFEHARRQLRELGLGVVLTFGQSGEDRTVWRTDPASGKIVRRGITVKVYVRGMAPYATIPGIVGVPCRQAGSIVADHGLVPQYPTGRTGVVLRTDPEQAPDRLRWNDTLKVYCGMASPSPTPS